MFLPGIVAVHAFSVLQCLKSIFKNPVKKSICNIANIAETI